MSHMRVIALTSANEAAMHAVASQLLQAASTGQLPLSVMVGVKNAEEAQAIFSGAGELWRVGLDSGKPELDALVDRDISDMSPVRLATETAQALRRFVTRGNLQARRAS